MTNTTVFEVRCDHCNTSFAPGTKHCVHCGRRITGGLIAALGAASGTASDDSMANEASGPFRPGPLHDDDEEEAQTLGGGRSPVWILTALFLVVSAVLRGCVEQ